MALGHLSNNDGSSTFTEHFKKKLEQYEKDEKKAMDGNDDNSYRVELYVYDMSKGLIKTMSPALLGKQIEGLWHTGVVAYGREYFFGSGGIESCRPGGTILGEPERVEDLGHSQVPYQLFLEYIFGLGESSYKPGAYDLLKHNCNNFSEEVSEFLCGRGIPKDILALPDEVLNTPFGEAVASSAKLLKLKNSKSSNISLTISSYAPEIIRKREDPELDELNSAIEEVRENTRALENRRHSLNEKLLKKERKERKKEKKERKKKNHRSSSTAGEEKQSRHRRSCRGESVVHFDPDVHEISQRRFSDPGSPEPLSVPSSKPPLPLPKKVPIVRPPSPVVRTPSPSVNPAMESEEAAPSVPASELEDDLPQEVAREPPILFKDEIDVSSPYCVLSRDDEEATLSSSSFHSSSSSFCSTSSSSASSKESTNSPCPSSEFLSHSSKSLDDLSMVERTCNFDQTLQNNLIRPIPMYPGKRGVSVDDARKFNIHASGQRKHPSPVFDHWSKDPSLFKHSNYTVRSNAHTITPLNDFDDENVSQSAKSESSSEKDDEDLSFKNNLLETPVIYSPYFRKLKTSFNESDLTRPEDVKHVQTDDCKIINTSHFTHFTNSKFSLNKRFNNKLSDNNIAMDESRSIPKRNENYSCSTKSRPKSLVLYAPEDISDTNDEVFTTDKRVQVRTDKLTSLYRPKSLDLSSDLTAMNILRNTEAQSMEGINNSKIYTHRGPRTDLENKIAKFLNKFSRREEGHLGNEQSNAIRNETTPSAAFEPKSKAPFKSRFLKNKVNLDDCPPIDNSITNVGQRIRSKNLNLKLDLNAISHEMEFKQHCNGDQLEMNNGISESKNVKQSIISPQITEIPPDIKRTQVTPDSGIYLTPKVSSNILEVKKENQRETAINVFKYQVPPVSEVKKREEDEKQQMQSKHNEKIQQISIPSKDEKQQVQSKRNEKMKQISVPSNSCLSKLKIHIPDDFSGVITTAKTDTSKVTSDLPSASEPISKAVIKDTPSNPPPSYEVAVTKTASYGDSSDYSTDDESCLSRSSTQSSVNSTMSFGSSYYTLYIMDQTYRPKTPDDILWSPENSPPPEDLLRSDSSSSFRTITPDAEYFEDNNRAFRAMRGLSIGSSNDSLLTCFSRPQSVIGSTSTLCHSPASSPTNEGVNHHSKGKDCVFRSRSMSPKHKLSLMRTFSLDSLLKQYPHSSYSFDSISTFGLAPSSHSSSLCPVPNPARPPSTDSPILFECPSQESLLLFRPLPRYSARSVSPEPQSAVLCYLGPARPYEPSFVFTDILKETIADFDGFVSSVAERLGAEEQHHMEELRAYVVEDEGSWALGDDFNMLFARVFHDPSIPDEARRHLIRIMAAAALKDDVILMLHQDRKEHTIMNFANKIESLPQDQQEALALFFCNMFEHLSPSEWLLYISEWSENNQQISNIRVTTKVAVNALLHSNAKVQEYGTALMYNLGTKEVKTVVFDDVAPELAMAILQYFSLNPPEEFLWRVLTALCRFCYASTEVPALIKMIGPDPNSYQGMSQRIDQVIEEINTKLSRVRLF